MSEFRKRSIESVNCRIIFLPPYSPDLNPIEKF
ncbi:transposase [Candidatus Sarmatiella mevalonica]|nr:transposase [Candidatus Sarmatiella mevalonica]